MDDDDDDNDDNDADSGSCGIVDFRRRCSDTTEETPSVAGVLLIVKGRGRSGVTKDTKDLNDELFFVFFSAVFSEDNFNARIDDDEGRDVEEEIKVVASRMDEELGRDLCCCCCCCCCELVFVKYVLV